MNRPNELPIRPDWINRRLTMGIFLAVAGRGGAYLSWFIILFVVAAVLAKSLDAFAWLRRYRKR
jgi:hypothetical protein